MPGSVSVNYSHPFSEKLVGLLQHLRISLFSCICENLSRRLGVVIPVVNPFFDKQKFRLLTVGKILQ
jgi:hypothetical protein